jgi:hypothetical protein
LEIFGVVENHPKRGKYGGKSGKLEFFGRKLSSNQHSGSTFSIWLVLYY